MAITEENAPVYITRCELCGAKGPWSATVTEAILLAKRDGWHVRRAKILNESSTLCPACKPQRQPKRHVIQSARWITCATTIEDEKR